MLILSRHSRLAGRRRDGAAPPRTRGSVAIEVLLIVPLILLMLLGFSELYLYMRATSMVEHAAFTLANSLGQMPYVVDDSSVSNANNLGTLWSDAALLADPDDLKNHGGVIITSVCDGTSGSTNCGWNQFGTQSLANGVPKICWQASTPWTGVAMQSQVTSGSVLPPQSTWPFYRGDAALVIEVFYRYNPFPMTSTFWHDAPGATTIYRRVYARQRAMNWTSMPLMAIGGAAGAQGSNGCPGVIATGS
ncbi:TadE/TadG family type IV pilus assembly protein [Paraburkholderia caballeronis]|uniref:TadE-like protein n=1 Tax=Paraburkholderia caballeronis TaxID=416943 RepID=A0A1H7RRN7_9BURK|nr:TadE/TadG family type IV pilus assembly protein [Paraburkholderia caballeronis]PXW23170.1 TadE-like protein [Paraburkholderia caballeronis]PXW97834.1 TadE-like protein [Paraburkholderia caballeronis]RAJ94804.1 TadE-like protein [Paraburkholderia caballeronis]TDV11685.1 TadE-like protein [Paraburkholderia caballeronis]TDV14766.1 TadE-like protein [Paraburkholderia caballeronis]